MSADGGGGRPGVPIAVDVVIAAPAESVWAELERIEDHVEWMHDAVAIRFTSEQRRGVGTEFLCDTKVGPFRLTDEMFVAGWEQGVGITVAHRGVVTGEGRFRLVPLGRSATRLSWEEELVFPWWMGAAVGAWFARPVLAFIWRRNLAALKQRIESGACLRPV
jgi:hypothetical protein